AIDGTIDGLPLLALSEFGLDLRLLPRESNRHAPIASLPVTLQNPHLIESSGMWTEEQTAAVRAAIRKLLLYVDSPEPPQGRPKRPRRPKAT
ncbi:MAG: hypothetical protein HYR84_15650, partial [Planctomycetes bacterium]|nr:hypothetical protein [Planctomycetota bacterium]